MQLVLRFVLLVSLLWIGSLASDRVKLRDVEVLTLRQGEWTSARRNSAIKQLKCVGGTAGQSAPQPQVVQCYNRGWDGHDVQWECKAELDQAYKLGGVEVSCEGYDYPDDPYILRGSCGLEYKLDYTEQGKRQSQSGSSFFSSNKDYHKSQDSPGIFGSVVFFAMICIIIYIVYKSCIESPHGPNGPTGGSGTSGFYPGPGGGGGGNPPPYGWRPNDAPPPYDDSTHKTGQHHEGRARQSPFGGFWTGLGAGGLAGYFLGNRRNSGYNRGYGTGYGYGGGPSTSAGTSSWFGGPSTSSAGSSSSTHTSSGFGGTRRR